jgi:hypothetical protein
MAEISLDRGTSDSPLSRKRRKIRKGTQSCWECKRRKTRCIFVSPTELTCVGCKSRGAKCIGQEFDDEILVSPQKANRDAALVQQANRTDVSIPPCLEEIPIPAVEVSITNKSDALCRKLSAVWPEQQELDLIFRLPLDTISLYHGVICTPYSKIFGQNLPLPRDILQLPSPSSHPVLFAWKLLLLGIFLQNISSSAAQGLAGTTSCYGDLMSRVIEAAITVTSNDELVESIEGIECIVLESMYHNNAGNLRRAYLTMRRAMVLAQTMRLHREIDPSSLVFLEPETRSRIDPKYMWFRIVQSDRYLSMMLGLPHGSTENTFASPRALEDCSAMERMERIMCMAGGRILLRNETNIEDLVETKEIDNLLRKAAACMPPKWWLVPDLRSTTTDDIHILRETIRMITQLTYYHILAQLHLPYLLRPSTNREHDYSKITAVNASREILARFIVFRDHQTIGSYCRGIDFLAFIATTTLSLAHIAARQNHSINTYNSNVFDFLAHQTLGDRGMMERVLESMEHMSRVSKDRIALKIASILHHLLIIEADTANEARYSAESASGEEELECSGKVSDVGHGLRINIPYIGTVKVEFGARVDDTSPSNAVATHTIEEQDGVEYHQHQPTVLTHSANYRTSSTLENGDHCALSAHLNLIEEPWKTSFPSSDITQDDQLFHSLPVTDPDNWDLQGVDLALFENLVHE